MTGEIDELTATSVGVAVEAVAAAADVRSDRVLAGCSGRASADRRIRRTRSALIHIYKNTPGRHS